MIILFILCAALLLPVVNDLAPSAVYFILFVVGAILLAPTAINLTLICLITWGVSELANGKLQELKRNNFRMAIINPSFCLVLKF